MGLTLGLVGAGGSILTVPILVYLMDVPPVVATGYSLLVVGSAALAGAMRYWRNNLVNFRAAIIFTLPAMMMVLITRTFIVPAIPEFLFNIPKDTAIMLFFSILMIISAIFMLSPVKTKPKEDSKMTTAKAIKLISGSAGIGLLTGTVGAGGGFLIIPTLIVLFGLSVKEAIGTSLAIISVNSLVGFRGDINAGIPLDWHLLSIFLGLTICGMWFGTSLGGKIDGEKLKKIFGSLTLIIGLFVMIENLYSLIK
jgi:uncharacterized membrane protein YfcA